MFAVYCLQSVSYGTGFLLYCYSIRIRTYCSCFSCILYMTAVLHARTVRTESEVCLPVIFRFLFRLMYAVYVCCVQQYSGACIRHSTNSAAARYSAVKTGRHSHNQKIALTFDEMNKAATRYKAVKTSVHSYIPPYTGPTAALNKYVLLYRNFFFNLTHGHLHTCLVFFLLCGASFLPVWLSSASGSGVRASRPLRGIRGIFWHDVYRGERLGQVGIRFRPASGGYERSRYGERSTLYGGR